MRAQTRMDSGPHGEYPVHPFIAPGAPMGYVEYPLYGAAYADGSLRLWCSGMAGVGGSARECQLAEVFLICTSCS